MILLLFLCCLLLPNLSWAEDYALLIGVNHPPEFELPDGSRPRPLRGAEQDALSLASLLQSRFGLFPERITRLLGDQATLQNVRTHLTALQRKLTPQDRLIFHFSGHGTQIQDRKPFDEEDDLDEALCLYDSRADGSNLLRDDELGLLLEEFNVAGITLLLDCCHAGTGNKELDAEIVPRFLPTADAKQSRPARQLPWRDLRSPGKSLTRQEAAFFACRPEQQAYERRFSTGKTSPAENSVRSGQFTHFLLLGLETGAADLNSDGRFTQSEVLQYINRQLDQSFNHLRSEDADRQHSVLEASRPEEFLFFLSK